MGERGPRQRQERIGGYLRSISIAGAKDTAANLPYRPRKLFRVSEIAEHLGITRQTIHNYATIGLITEEDRTPGGQRLFNESVFDRLLLIQRLKPMHRLSEIRRLLANQNRPRPASPAAGARVNASPQSQGASTHVSGARAACPDANTSTQHPRETRSRDQRQT